MLIYGCDKRMRVGKCVKSVVLLLQERNTPFHTAARNEEVGVVEALLSAMGESTKKVVFAQPNKVRRSHSFEFLSFEYEWSGCPWVLQCRTILKIRFEWLHEERCKEWFCHIYFSDDGQVRPFHVKNSCILQRLNILTSYSPDVIDVHGTRNFRCLHWLIFAGRKHGSSPSCWVKGREGSGTKDSHRCAGGIRGPRIQEDLFYET